MIPDHGNLVKTGYTFDAWYENAQGTGKFYKAGDTYTVNGNCTLYAKWTANTYTVTYNGNGSTTGSTAASIHTYDVEKTLTANGFSRIGHIFAGWAATANDDVEYINEQSVINLTATQGATVTLYAKWNATVTLKAIPGVTAPKYGETPVKTITENLQYNGTISWDGNPNIFAPGVEYIATIILTAKEGYTMQGVAENFFSVKDADVVTNAVNAGVVTAVFPPSSPPTIPTDFWNTEDAEELAEWLNGLGYDFITVRQESNVVIVEHTPGESEQAGQIELNIPAGVKVEWGIGGYHTTSGEPTLTLEGYGTLELTSELPLRHSYGGDLIFIESDSPTLVIPGEVYVATNGTAIRTAPGSSPNIFLSNASGLYGAYGAIVLLGGGNIVVTGNTTIEKGQFVDFYIYRDPSATVNGFYDNNTNKAYFNGGSWADGKNLFQK
jgi:uncharacterized repeat protein (TIGR02543 family)